MLCRDYQPLVDKLHIALQSFHLRKHGSLLLLLQQKAFCTIENTKSYFYQVMWPSFDYIQGLIWSSDMRSVT